jgi:hypothetical protein
MPYLETPEEYIVEIEAKLFDREATIVSQQDELHALRLELGCIRKEYICAYCGANFSPFYPISTKSERSEG